MAPPSKIRRPVLSPHVAHAHAFAAVPSPGAPKSANSSYFPLPTPPAPLRSFTLAQSEDSNGDVSTSYPTSTVDPPQPAQSNVNSGQKSQGGPSGSSAPRPVSDTPPRSPFARAPSRNSQYQFASAPFSACTPNRSSGFSSSSSASVRSALSIAEIDCFFVQGSRASAYGAARSNSSSQSRPPSTGGGSASLSEMGLSSNEEGSAVWTSDEAERERQREERKAFMKARQDLRQEARRRKRISTAGPAENTHTATWREVIQSQAVIPLKGIPESRAGSSRGASASGSPRGPHHATQPAESLADISRAPLLPSGPGPPSEPDVPLDTLVDSLSASMIVSDGIPEGQKNDPDPDSTPPADGTVPSLNRFDSDDTAVGIPAIITSIDTHPS